jgi:D-alanine transaminase
MKVFLNGEYMPQDEAKISPTDRGFLFGDGIYEVVRCYGGKFLSRDQHLARMAHGCAEIEISGLEDYDFASICRELIERNSLAEQGLVYLQVTRGAASPRTHAFPIVPVPPTVYGMAFPFVQKADPSIGVSVVTTPDLRWGRCDLKTIGLLANCLTQQHAKENNVFESILIKDGLAIESSASSFFAVIDGQLRTAPKSNHILPSITRETVLRLCSDAGILHSETPVKEQELGTADEMFLAGTTLEVMPIVQVDGKTVGNGAPGPITTQLQGLFQKIVEAL